MLSSVVFTRSRSLTHFPRLPPVYGVRFFSKTTGSWYTLPPFASSINGSALGKQLASRDGHGDAGAEASVVTAVKWVTRCCPELPRSLVQKLFRLRQVRKEVSSMDSTGSGAQGEESRLKRVAAKDKLNLGDRIYLPITVQEVPSEKPEYSCSEEEMSFLHSLVVYKDPAIIAINKPPGMPVQGGIGIKRSLDELAATCLKYDYSEPPRLVHRLDRDSSGILVMARTQTSAAVLHSIFREKTLEAPDEDMVYRRGILQKKYWALVIGCPRRPKGLISAPLGKVVVDSGKSDRITVVDSDQTVSSQHAITEYKVIASSSHGFSWLELSPLTGRKHQLRVHCAEVLGTPIVGDYKYGWQAHRKRKLFPNIEKDSKDNDPNGKTLPFGLDLRKGSIFDNNPRLHLHCKRMSLPNVSQALLNLESSSDCDLSVVKSLKLGASLPLYMQRSWDALSS